MRTDVRERVINNIASEVEAKRKLKRDREKLTAPVEIPEDEGRYTSQEEDSG
jgi:hypothetical protein